MTTFVDTSALIALLDAGEARHAACAREWKRLLDGNEPLVTTSYVVVETCALAQRRLGIEAVRTLNADFLPLLIVDWVDQEVHESGMAAMVTTGRKDLSLVDCVNFEVMRRRDVNRAFTLDSDFSKQGFTVAP